MYLFQHMECGDNMFSLMMMGGASGMICKSSSAISECSIFTLLVTEETFVYGMIESQLRCASFLDFITYAQSPGKYVDFSRLLTAMRWSGGMLYA